jgi:DDE family transposase
LFNVRVARRPKPKVQEKDLRGFRLLEHFQTVLERVEPRFPRHPTFWDPRRRLEISQYLGLYLFGLFNPVIDSMRGLCAATKLQSVQEISGRPVSLGSFSEAQHVLDPALLEAVMEELVEEVRLRAPDAREEQRWRVVDSSVFDVVRRMGWAHFQTHNGVPQSAIRLHVSYDLITGAPCKAVVAKAKVGEQKIWQTQWDQAMGEVGDRNYSLDYKLLDRLDEAGGFFLVRLREKSFNFEALEELPLSQEDTQAHVTRQAWGLLGKERPRHKVRVLWIETDSGESMALATNLSVEKLPAHTAGVLYRKRWQVELFFRWIKCILNCRHFLAESERGAAIQLYLALIAALILQLYTGSRPDKRTWEMLQWYSAGMARPEELEDFLERRLNSISKKTK